MIQDLFIFNNIPRVDISIDTNTTFEHWSSFIYFHTACLGRYILAQSDIKH